MYSDELQQLIRFNIDQLSSLNGQADFEKLCLYYSRARIHKNVIPATGPVQAGGDQGRDFETFYSYLSSLEPNANRFMLGKANGQPIAFACSLQKNPIAANGKIEKDVASILKSGSTVERIYFFSGQDIAVAKRHKCQAEIKKKYTVDIEIIDAQALSFHLCEGDIFWIATQYLKIPADYYPRPQSSDWYTELLKEYKTRQNNPVTFEEFSEIKSAVRYIYKSDTLKSDLVFWVPFLDSMINNALLPETLIRNSIYEKFVVGVMSFNNIEGQEVNIYRYFKGLEQHTAISELEDACVLLSFCNSSKFVIGNSFTDEFFTDTATKLEKILLQKIKTAFIPDTTCYLKEIYASFLFHDPRSKGDFMARMDNYIKGIAGLVPSLKNTNYYPVNRLADRINEHLAIILELPIEYSGDKLEKIATEVDKIIEKKSGKEIAAQKVKQRALTYYNKGDILKALESLHQLKIYDFSDERMNNVITVCLLIADCYSKLDLHFASKYYSWVAAYLAINTNPPKHFRLSIKSLSQSANSEYESGSWLHFLDTIEFLFVLHNGITKDFSIYEHEDNKKILYYPSVIINGARLLVPDLLPLLERKVSRWGYIKDDIEYLSSELHKKFGMDNKDDFLKTTKEQIYGRVFNDVGLERKIEFSAWGAVWRISFLNSYDNNVVGESFISMLQIVIASLSQDELYTIKSALEIEIKSTFNNEVNISRGERNKRSLWVVSLPFYAIEKSEDIHHYNIQYLAVVQEIIKELSLLPAKEYEKIIERKITKESISSEIFFARSYSDLYENFIPNNEEEGLKKQEITNPLATQIFNPETNEQLYWEGSLSPLYNYDKNIEAIRNRIANSRKAISVTLPKLLESTEFKKVILAIQSKGWLDWQILHGVANTAFNYKLNTFYDARKVAADINLITKYFKMDETEWQHPIPFDIFTEEAILIDLDNMFLLAMLPGFGLQNHMTAMVDCMAIKELLKTRFNFFEDGREIKIF